MIVNVQSKIPPFLEPLSNPFWSYRCLKNVPKVLSYLIRDAVASENMTNDLNLRATLTS